MPYWGAAHTHTFEVNNYASENPFEHIRAADETTSKALALAPSSALAHLCRGHVLFAMRQPDRALREYEIAISLDRNQVSAHGHIGLIKLLLGRAEETEAHFAHAMRLSPYDPSVGHFWHFWIGMADLYLGRLERAVNELRRSVEINPRYGLAYFFLAAALALAGSHEQEAAEACTAGRRLMPNFGIAKLRSDAQSDNPVYLVQRQRVCDGLRNAGMPEQ
jgi:tetratricopeptide (TPR) repeat protein